MDQGRAKRIANELSGKEVGGWTVLDYINYGKSALVVKASRKEQVAALKIFDPDLVERFGRDTQLGRIEREKSLIGSVHPNLIEIKDGGACGITKCYGCQVLTFDTVDTGNAFQISRKSWG